LRILLWMFIAFSLILSVALYTMLFAFECHTIKSMTPVWILPVFPAAIVGTVAASVAKIDPVSTQALNELIAGVTLQGLGFLVSLMMSSIFIHRLMSYDLPTPPSRPGMFMILGPFAYTSLALISLGEQADHAFPAALVQDQTAQIIRVGFTGCGIFLWAFSLWAFCICAVACILSVIAGGMSFRLTWYAFVFPNVGFVLCTCAIGKALSSKAIQIVGEVMGVGIVLVYIWVVHMHIRGLIRRDIMYPFQDEDKPEEDPEMERRPNGGIDIENPECN